MRQKIIIDTNLWISFLISNKIFFIETLIRKYQFVLLFSKEFVLEFLHVAKREKFRKYFKEDRIEVVLEILNRYGKSIPVYSKVNLCRDPKDNFLLNLSIDGKADFLITGDKDLLVLKRIERTQIVTIKQFEEISKS